jgi:hypothetical protein
LTVLFNGEPLEPWDPFARSERATRKLAEQRLVIDRDQKAYAVLVNSYVLPSQVQFSSVDAHAAAAGPKKWNRHQGFYIYRGDRMIQSGGWNRLRTMDEHSKLARLAVDVPAELEDLFQINVAKMRVVIPDELRPQLRALAAGVTNVAQEVYRRRLHLVPSDSGQPVDESEPGSSWTLGDMWPVIAEVLARELHDHPELLDRVLVALANARPLVMRPEAAASS